MILFLFFPIFLWASEKDEICQTILKDPCALSLEWKNTTRDASWILPAKSPEEFSNQERKVILTFLEQEVEAKSFSANLLQKINEIESKVSAPCLANKFLSYTMERSVRIYPCPVALQEMLDDHFDHPNEETKPDFLVLKRFVPVAREAISGEKEKLFRSYLEEIKKELVRILKQRNAAPKFIRLAQSLTYTEDSCIRSKGRDKVSFEAGKEINVCQGFVWQENTVVNAVWTLAHEAAHSLDACDLSRRDLLRFDRETKKIEVMIKNHPLKEHYLEALKNIVDAPYPYKEESACDFVNLHEAFADRLAADLSIAVLKKFSRPETVLSRRPHFLSQGTRICRIKDFPDLDKIPAYFRHPLGNARMSFFLRQPWVREQLECFPAENRD